MFVFQSSQVSLEFILHYSSSEKGQVAFPSALENGFFSSSYFWIQKQESNRNYIFLLNPDVSLIVHLPSATQAKSCESVLHSHFEAHSSRYKIPLFDRHCFGVDICEIQLLWLIQYFKQSHDSRSPEIAWNSSCARSLLQVSFSWKANSTMKTEWRTFILRSVLGINTFWVRKISRIR